MGEDFDLLQFFHDEATLALASMNDALATLEEDPSNTRAAERAERSIHTLGGLAAVADLPDIAELTRSLEAFLPRLPTQTRLQTLKQWTSLMRPFVASAAKGNTLTPPELPALLKSLKPHPTNGKQQKTILVVDDSRTVLHFTSRALAEAGFRVLTAKTEADARATLANEIPALILLDLSLVSGRGEALLSGLFAGGENPPCPVLLFSNRNEAELRALSLRAGAAGFLVKTGDPAALVQAVRPWVYEERVDNERGDP